MTLHVASSFWRSQDVPFTPKKNMLVYWFGFQGPKGFQRVPKKSREEFTIHVTSSVFRLIVNLFSFFEKRLCNRFQSNGRNIAVIRVVITGGPLG